MRNINIRKATAADLGVINRTIESAVMNWPMAQRVKRLSVSSLQYDASDLEDMDILVAEFRYEIVGVAAWQPGQLHGLYVLPVLQKQGIGQALLQAVFAAARHSKSAGLLVKSQRVSRAFFEHIGLEPVTPQDDEYPWQYWKELA